jgi:hypothetical protein
VNPNDIVLKLISALNQVAIPYMVVGSFSSNIHGIERNTKDADLVLQLDAKSINPLVVALGPDFSFDPQLSFETVTMTYRYIVSHRDPHFKIELFLLSDDAHDMERFKRRLTGIIAGQKVQVASAEDVVITKLRWSKQGRRAKDVDDVRGVLGVQQGRLDMPYIRHWCDHHGTRQLLEQTLGSLPPLPTAI